MQIKVPKIMIQHALFLRQNYRLSQNRFFSLFYLHNKVLFSLELLKCYLPQTISNLLCFYRTMQESNKCNLAYVTGIPIDIIIDSEAFLFFTQL